MQAFSRIVTRYPKLVLLILVAITVFMYTQLGNLRWETDARVYMPKGHPAIKYDEEAEHVFGVKDALIIGIVNDGKSIYNPVTLAKVARITEKVAKLPGVIANRTLDVASLSTATAFTGTNDSMGAVRLMETVPTTQAEAEALRSKVDVYADLFVGNIVSADGTATMIRAKLKEGAVNRYQTYWQIKGIVAAEEGETDSGGWGEWASQGNWNNGQQSGDSGEQGGWQKQDWNKGDQSSGQWPAWGGGQKSAEPFDDNGDKFFLAGRPVIEVTSGQHALQDIKMMVPLLIAVMAVALFIIFKTGRGILIPLCVMAGAIIWTLGVMALMDVPLYTISTMMPVILVAIGIGDSVHLLSNYYNNVLKDPYRESALIVQDSLAELGAPLITTSVTTGVGFLALMFADMPPFKVFGIFTVLGIFFSWFLTVTFAAAMLAVMRPKVSGYLTKKRALRVHSEQDATTRCLVAGGAWALRHQRLVMVVLAALVLFALAGVNKVYVNSSWLSDFKDGSDIKNATKIINERFDGSIFLNIVIEGKEKGALKDPELLKRIEMLQDYAESLPYVGDTLSIVDYLKSMNKTLHAENEDYNILPQDKAKVSEDLYLYSISGQPELLDEVVDFDYQRANVTVSIKTDETLHLRNIIDSLRDFSEKTFAEEPVTVNFAGSANNSYVWADLLINSQATAIVFSKLAIFVIAVLIFRSLYIGLMVVLPVALTTALVAGGAGWLAIPMDVSTALAAGVAIGVGVDYAVHYIFKYVRQTQAGASHDEAVAETLRTVGRTIVFNAVVVVLGFAVLLMSQFPPHIKLGVFVVVYMVLSCLMALITLPILLRRRVL